jgi:hypothetical protein
VILPDIIGWLNQPVWGDPDPQFTRLIIGLFVMAVAFRWTRDALTSWPTWARKVKREKQWLSALLVVNGLLLIAAANRDDPVRILTLVLGGVFVGLASSLYIRFKNDGSTAPVYPALYPSNIFARLR